MDLIKLARVVLILSLTNSLPALAWGQGPLTTFAGKDYVFPRQGVTALDAPLGRITSVAVDPAGNVFALDTFNNIVVKITPDGRLTVVAGSGQDGSSGSGDAGPALEAPLSSPSSIAVD